MSNKYTLAIFFSIALHTILIIVLFFGDFSHKIKPISTPEKVQPIQAVAINKTQVEKQVKRIQKQKRDEAKRLQEIEKQAAYAKARRKKEEKRIKKLERQRQKKEREKKAADAAAKKAKAKANNAEKIRQKKEQEKQRAEQAASEAKAKRLKEEQAAKRAKKLRQQQEEQRRRKEQEAKELAAQQRLLEQQMAEEMAKRQKIKRQQMLTEIERYTALITQSIKQNLITDRSTMEGKSCRLIISLAPSGFVTNVVTGKGDRIVCNAAKTAVYKAGTLPVSKDPDVFKEMKTISLIVAPDTFN